MYTGLNYTCPEIQDNASPSPGYFKVGIELKGGDKNVGLQDRAGPGAGGICPHPGAGCLGDHRDPHLAWSDSW